MFQKTLSILFAAALTSAVAGAQGTVFFDDFEGGFANWTVTHPASCGPGVSCSGGVTWYVVSEDSDCSSTLAPFPSSFQCARFGHAQNCDFNGDNGAIPTADMRSIPLVLPTGSAAVTLHLLSASEAEDDGSDRRWILVDHPGLAAPVQVASITSSGWQALNVDLTPFAGQTVQLIFRFETLDAFQNDGAGWFIDDLIVDYQLFASFCAGDGSATACPCGNVGSPGNGCASSVNPAGASLGASGITQLATDTAVLTASGLSNSVALFFQGTQATAAGQGAVFGDGLRCVSGSITRLRRVQAVGGIAQVPGPGDPALSVMGSIPPGGGQRMYQMWYRNAAPFCTASTFNLTNGLTANWIP